MVEEQNKSWRINRQINLSVIMQLLLLASLILGSWINIQSQLSLLQRDVAVLLSGQSELEKELEILRDSSISYDYRLKAIERETAER